MSYAPIAVFAYNRKNHIEDCLINLQNNVGASDSIVYIFSDGPKKKSDIEKVDEVRSFLNKFQLNNQFLEVHLIMAEKNQGLANSIIQGVTKIVKQYNKVIVVEDDLITTKYFLQYMNMALDFYENDRKIGSISGYTYPIKIPWYYRKQIYAIGKGECWGWATWKDRFLNVDWNVSDYECYHRNPFKRYQFNCMERNLDKMLTQQMKGQLDSWAVRWCYHLFRNKLLTIYPVKTYVYNDGFDGSGTHCSIKNKDDSARKKFDFQEDNSLCSITFEHLKVNPTIARRVAIYERGTFLEWTRIIFKKYLK